MFDSLWPGAAPAGAFCFRPKSSFVFVQVLVSWRGSHIGCVLSTNKSHASICSYHCVPAWLLLRISMQRPCLNNPIWSRCLPRGRESPSSTIVFINPRVLKIPCLKIPDVVFEHQTYYFGYDCRRTELEFINMCPKCVANSKSLARNA